MINKELFDKFKRLYEEKYDITLTDEETRQMANDLINLMKVLLKPEPKPIINGVTNTERRQNETITAIQY